MKSDPVFYLFSFRFLIFLNTIFSFSFLVVRKLNLRNKNTFYENKITDQMLPKMGFIIILFQKKYLIFHSFN